MLLDDDCTEVLAGTKIQNKKKAETQVLLDPGGETPNFTSILHRPTLVKALRLQIGMS